MNLRKLFLHLIVKMKTSYKIKIFLLIFTIIGACLVAAAYPPNIVQAAYPPNTSCSIQFPNFINYFPSGPISGLVDTNQNCCVTYANVVTNPYCQKCEVTESVPDTLFLFHGVNDDPVTITPQCTNAAYTLPCANESFANSNLALCSCEYTDPSGNLAVGHYNGSTYTALGCISGNLGTAINTIISISVGLAAIIALIIIMIGGYIIMTNPNGKEQLGKARTLITNGILGLLLIIFCVIVLKIIGIDVLGINELTVLLG